MSEQHPTHQKKKTKNKNKTKKRIYDLLNLEIKPKFLCLP